jgi:transposase-like protein
VRDGQDVLASNRAGVARGLTGGPRLKTGPRFISIAGRQKKRSRRGNLVLLSFRALALNPDGEKDVLGLWIEHTEGAKFWLKVINELRGRGVNDILIAVVDGLKGFPEAIATVFPQTVVQTCIIHLIRNSLAFVSWKFEAEWGKRYPAIGQA